MDNLKKIIGDYLHDCRMSSVPSTIVAQGIIGILFEEGILKKK